MITKASLSGVGRSRSSTGRAGRRTTCGNDNDDADEDDEKEMNLG